MLQHPEFNLFTLKANTAGSLKRWCRLNPNCITTQKTVIEFILLW